MSCPSKKFKPVTKYFGQTYVSDFKGMVCPSVHHNFSFFEKLSLILRKVPCKHSYNFSPMAKKTRGHLTVITAF